MMTDEDRDEEFARDFALRIESVIAQASKALEVDPKWIVLDVRPNYYRLTLGGTSFGGGETIEAAAFHLVCLILAARKKR